MEQTCELDPLDDEIIIKMSSFPDILNPGENRIADKMLSTLVHCSLSDGDIHVMCSGCPVLLVPNHVQSCC